MSNLELTVGVMLLNENALDAHVELKLLLPEGVPVGEVLAEEVGEILDLAHELVFSNCLLTL
jgi:hypothetical protein